MFFKFLPGNHRKNITNSSIIKGFRGNFKTGSRINDLGNLRARYYRDCRGEYKA